MHAHLELGLGRLNLAASLRTGRGMARRRWVALLAALLTLPFTVALILNVLVQAHVLGQGLLGWLFGSTPGQHTLGRALTLGPPLALLLLAVDTIRIHAGRSDRGWSARAEAVLTPAELAVGVVALLIAAIFFGHLAADSFACANGNHAAC
jgi:hypothetical protein